MISSRELFLGIDCGTQGTKALLIDTQGNRHGQGYARHAIIERENGAREQEPLWWVEAARTAVRQALQNHPAAPVQALAVSGQQHGLVVLDEAGQIIRPAKLWNDTETAPQNAELIERMGGKAAIFERLGMVPLTGYTVSKLLWLRDHEPENFSRIRHILLPHEYLNYWLTGKMAAEFGDASGTGFFDVRTREWMHAVLDLIDGGTGQLAAALPALLRTEQPVGTVLPQVAEQLGMAPGCLVAPGGGDNMMGAVGTGNVQEGVVTLSLGTSSTVYSYRSAPVLDASGSVAPFCSSTGAWLPLVCTMNATNVVTQTLELLGLTVTDIEAALHDTAPGAQGLVFLPFLNGERTPDLPAARGSLHGLNAVNFTPANLVRAAIEGVTFGILNGLDRILQGAKASTVLVIGGGARSAAWRQMLADATGASIQVPLEEEAGCLGAAIQAMYVYGQHTGAPESFVALCERLVHVDAARAAEPNRVLAAAYRAARDTYDALLRKQYGV